MTTVKKSKPLIFLDIETSHLKPGYRGEYYGELLEVAVIIDYNGWTQEKVWRMAPENKELHHPEAIKVNDYHVRSKAFVNLDNWTNHIQDIHNTLTSLNGLIVGHNVQFDIHYLNWFIQQTQLEEIPVRAVDTMTLAHEHLSPIGLHGLGFDRIRSFMGWELSGHDALNDARDCRRLYYELKQASVFKRLWWWCCNVYRIFIA